MQDEDLIDVAMEQTGDELTDAIASSCIHGNFYRTLSIILVANIDTQLSDRQLYWLAAS